MDVNAKQTYQYGLIGEKLGHSFSKVVHEKLADYCYDLIEIQKDELDRFVKKRAFHAINVTIPYKETVIPYLDFIDENAKAIGAVNTIVNQNGKLYGYNTDFAGFLYTLDVNQISLSNKVVLIMGSGGTCKTVLAVAKSQNAKEILIASRTKSEDTISYDEALNRKDIKVIINASPKGMYPSNDERSIDLSGFPNLEAVVDVIYNPLQTRLLQQAKQLQIKHANGLLMLVAQAKFAVEYFLDKQINNNKINEIYDEIKASLSNIVLVGMPSCGKTILGKKLARVLNRELVDIDAVIKDRTQMTIEEIFKQNGEDSFRKLEIDITAEFAKKNSLVISTGGGVIKNSINIFNLQQNGVIVFIDRPIESLLIGNGRPLSNSSEQIAKLYQERYQTYLDSSDFQVLNDCSIEDALRKLQQIVQ
ncbi:MAG: shikimate kinase [Oscillospiraceae bacterium]